MLADIRIHISRPIYKCTHMNIYVHENTKKAHRRMLASTSTRSNTRMHKDKNALTHANTLIHIRIHIQIHTCTDTCVRPQKNTLSDRRTHKHVLKDKHQLTHSNTSTHMQTLICKQVKIYTYTRTHRLTHRYANMDSQKIHTHRWILKHKIAH